MSTAASERPERDPQTRDDIESQPDSHGKFSLSEDWIATIAGLAILVLALLGLVPNIGEWF